MTRPYHYIRPYQFKLMPIEEPDEESRMLEAVDEAESALKAARKNLKDHVANQKWLAGTEAKRRQWFR